MIQINSKEQINTEEDDDDYSCELEQILVRLANIDNQILTILTKVLPFTWFINKTTKDESLKHIDNLEKEKEFFLNYINEEQLKNRGISDV